MSVQTGAGSILSIASAFGLVKAMSAISNAAEAVATLEASHGVAPGDYIVISSGWGELDGRTVRVSAVSTNDVTLEDIDTSDTSRYPPGSGAGTVREITTWTEIAQIKADSFSTSGGDQQFTDASPLSASVDRQLPTTKSAYNVTFEVMDTSAGFTVARNVSATPTPFRISKGAVNTVGTGIWSASEVGKISGREVTTYAVSMSIQSTPITYFA
jgi:hypothetical protein